MALEPITRTEKIMSGESLTPITREEMFLAKAAGMDVDTPEPITRREKFLSKISGGGGGGGASLETCSVAFCTDSWAVEPDDFVSITYSALVDGTITTKKVLCSDANFFGTYADVVKGTIFYCELTENFRSSYDSNTYYSELCDRLSWCFIIDGDGSIGFWND